MKAKDFECHITMKAPKHLAESAVKVIGRGWSFSCIDGDPVYGDVVLCYATNHFTLEEIARHEIDMVVQDIRHLGYPTVKVLRAKIEEVVYDERFANV